MRRMNGKQENMCSSYLLGKPAGEEGVKVLRIKPHEALQILSLVDVSLILLFC